MNYWRDKFWQYDWSGKHFWRSSGSMDVIVSEIGKGDTVLDLGCGRGELFKRLKDTNDYTGVDISPHLIKDLKNTFGDYFVEMDINDLNDSDPIDNTYDVVVIRDTLEALKDWKEVVRQITRIARKKVIIVLRRNLGKAPTRLVESDPENEVYVWDINEDEMTSLTGGVHTIIDGDSVIIINK